MLEVALAFQVRLSCYYGFELSDSFIRGDNLPAFADPFVPGISVTF